MIWWQLPVVAVVALATWWLLPAQWAPLAGPLGVVMVAFVVLFPLRVFPALLQGLQDLGFLGAVQLGGLVAGTLVTIVAVLSGAGLYALALGWVTTQVAPAALAWGRLRRRHASVRPAQRVRLAWADARTQLSRGVWISVSQIAQVLLTGTDLVVVGTLIGPEAAVLLRLHRQAGRAARQPAAAVPADGAAGAERAARRRGARAPEPGVAQHDAAAAARQRRHRRAGASWSTKRFVSWWVGAARFGGFELTAALVAGMFVRQVNFAAVYTLFCFGYERRLALTSVADGVVGVASMLVLVPLLGPLGAALGLVVGDRHRQPAGQPARAGARDRPAAAARSWPSGTAGRCGWPWCWWPPLGLRTVTAGEGWTVLPVAFAVGALYLAVMVPELTRPPLGPMLAERLGSWSAVRAGAAAGRSRPGGLAVARLNIGCGVKRRDDAVNLDISDRVGADVVHDLNALPWPFPSDSFEEVFAYDVLEHVHDVVRALEEIHRVCRPAARVHITVPHFSSANAFTDVTHRHWFGWNSFAPYTTEHELNHYSHARFARRTTRISFYASVVNRIVFRLANRWPERYERRWAWMFPAWFLYYELEVLK